jgi:hypothetical protein
MGGMFSVVKVREGLAANDYRDPGSYQHPPGTVAYEFKTAAAGEPPRQSGSVQPGKPAIELNVVKPPAKSGHRGH